MRIAKQLDAFGQEIGDRIDRMLNNVEESLPQWLQQLRNAYYRPGRVPTDPNEWNNYVFGEAVYNQDRSRASYTPLFLKIKGMFARSDRCGVVYSSYDVPPQLDGRGNVMTDSRGRAIPGADVVVKPRFVDYGSTVFMLDHRDLDPDTIGKMLHLGHLKKGPNMTLSPNCSKDFRQMAYAIACDRGYTLADRGFDRYKREYESAKRHMHFDQSIGMRVV